MLIRKLLSSRECKVEHSYYWQYSTAILFGLQTIILQREKGDVDFLWMFYLHFSVLVFAVKLFRIIITCSTGSTLFS
jgi:hypothetical protein